MKCSAVMRYLYGPRDDFKCRKMRLDKTQKALLKIYLILNQVST